MHQFGLKNFDMIIVFKDYKRPVQHINTIPMESIDAVKDWLNGVEMPFYEGNLNLQWGSIMKTVQEDPYTFFKDGGVELPGQRQRGREDGEDESEEESAFEMDESDFGSEASSEDESDFDENASQEAEDDAVSDDDEGEDWDELEKKAARKDREAAAEDGKGRAAAASKPSRKRKR